MKDGGPAFPCELQPNANMFGEQAPPESFEGMSLRDWFAGQVQADDRLVKCIRAMDDTVLAMFAFHPDSEREEWITEVEDASSYLGLEEVEKVTKRLMVEAKAIARVRFMQADAMLKERERD